MAVLTAGALLLAGCGGSSEREELGSTEEDKSEGSSEGGYEDFAGDQARAEAALLVLADFPSGWTRDDSDDEDVDDDEAFEDAFSDCVGDDAALFGDDDGPSASAAFSTEGFESVESDIGLTPSIEVAEETFALVSKVTSAACFEQAMVTAMEEDPEAASFSNASVETVSPPQLGDGTVWWRASVDVTEEVMEATVYIDMVVFRVDRALAMVSGLSVFSPFDAEKLSDYATLVANRLTGDAEPGAADPAPEGDEEDSSGVSDDEDAPEAQEATIVAGMSTSVDSIGTRYTVAGALATNPNTELGLYDGDVVFNLLAADGRVLDTESVAVPYIPPAGTVPVAPIQIGFDLAEEPASVDAVVIGNYRTDEGWAGVDSFSVEGVELVVSNEAFLPGSYGHKVQFQVQNPSDKVVEDGSWDCVLRSAGSIVGGVASGFFDPVAPGRSISVDSSVSVDVSGVDEVICRAYA